MRTGILVLALTCLASGAAGCGDDVPTEPTDPGTTVTGTTQLFTDTIASGGSKFYSFAVLQAQPLNITFASLSTGTPDQALSTPLTIGLGTPAGTGCAVTTSRQTAASFGPSIAAIVGAGTYCVNVSDSGALAGTAGFTVRIVLGTITNTAAPGTETFSSVLASGGSASRTITTSQAGNLTVTLEGLGAPAGATLGFGLGIPPALGSGCALTYSQAATPGASFTVGADIGTYCVELFDLATMAAPADFTIRIVKP